MLRKNDSSAPPALGRFSAKKILLNGLLPGFFAISAEISLFSGTPFAYICRSAERTAHCHGGYVSATKTVACVGAWGGCCAADPFLAFGP